MADAIVGDAAVARALGYAFLAGDWQHSALVTAAQRTLGGRPCWVAAMVEEVLAQHPVAPLDRPRRLADDIFQCSAFQCAAEQARERRRPLRAVRWVVAGTKMAESRWPVPALHDLGQLASWLELSPGQLLWLSDPVGRQRRLRPGRLHLYDYGWRPRPTGPPRLLEAPTPILKRVQRQVLAALLERIPVHSAAHGFVRGRSVLSHARRHLGAQVVVTADISNFFARVRPARLYGILRLAGYPEPVAHALTGVCTTATPIAVLSDMPAGGSAEDRAVLRSRLRCPHLPQGAPTSPALANLSCFHLDARLTGWADAFGAVYSRYADDLTFSGDAPLSLAVPPLLRGVRRISADEDFPLNPAKTRVQGRSGRQSVTGVVVNERPNVSREQYDRLRAVLHDAVLRGPEVANRSGHPDFRRHLDGRVEWVESVNPGRGRRLRTDLDAIVWPLAQDGG